MPPLYAAMVAGEVPYRPWLGPPTGPEVCFVCAAALDETNRSVEDVFPKWLQQDLRSLPDRTRRPLLLPNTTGIGLESILIPACRTCNGRYLSQLESRIATAFRAGTSAVRELSESDLRQWFTKIAYGSRHNDMRLAADRRDPQSARLATAGDLERLANLHWLLQEVRDVVVVEPGHSTFWVFSTQEVDCASCDWDFAAPIGWPNVAMFKHHGSVALGAVDDRGALDQLRDHPAFVSADHLSLHKTQVRALHAILVATAASLSERELPLTYGVSERRVWIKHSGSQLGSFDHEDDTREVADGVLAALIDQPLDVVQKMGGATGYLVRPDGAPREMPASC